MVSRGIQLLELLGTSTPMALYPQDRQAVPDVFNTQPGLSKIK